VAGHVEFTGKALEEQVIDGLTIEDVLESVLNANAITKVLRSRSSSCLRLLENLALVDPSVPAHRAGASGLLTWSATSSCASAKGAFAFRASLMSAAPTAGNGCSISQRVDGSSPRSVADGSAPPDDAGRAPACRKVARGEGSERGRKEGDRDRERKKGNRKRVIARGVIAGTFTADAYRQRRPKDGSVAARVPLLAITLLAITLTPSGGPDPDPDPDPDPLWIS
jgi:hypothetical protein